MPAGRPKGSRNRTPAFQRKLGEGGVTPVEYLLKVVRDKNRDSSERLEAAKAAAPYIHPRLSQVEQTVTHIRDPDEYTDSELAAIIRHRSGSGTPDEAPSEEIAPTLQ